MKIYWTSKSIPEFKGLNKQTKAKAWNYAYKMSFKHTGTYIGLILCGLCGGIGSYIGSEIEISRWIVAGIGGCVGGFIYSQIKINICRPYINQYINNQYKTLE